MAQTGELFEKYGSWYARWYDSARNRKTKKLGSLADFPKRDDIISIFQSHMSEVNDQPQNFVPAVGSTLSQFVNQEYFPVIAKDLRGSTRRSYIAIWANYVEPRLGSMKIRDIRTFDIQRALDAIVRSGPAQNPKHKVKKTRREWKRNSLARVRSFMSGIFGETIRAGLRKDDQNPVENVKIRGVKEKGKGETFAYTLDAIREILNVLSEPTRVLVAIAAYTGLRRGEIVGLKWADFDGTHIHVRRNICFGEKGEMTVELPKTEASEAAVPVIKPLRKILDAWKAKVEMRQIASQCWIFQAGFTRKKDHPASLIDAALMTPISPANVLRDAVLPILKKEKIVWLGYHAFRRGLATNLRALGVDDLTISEILRHSDVSVTRKSYIKRVSARSEAALGKLEVELAKKKVTTARSKDAALAQGMA